MVLPGGSPFAQERGGVLVETARRKHAVQSRMVKARRIIRPPRYNVQLQAWEGVHGKSLRPLGAETFYKCHCQPD